MAYGKSVPIWCVFYSTCGKRDWTSVRAPDAHTAAEIAQAEVGVEMVTSVDGPFPTYIEADQFGVDGR